jgi:RimJ/RimL family protein N-acetyltransferase
MDQPESRYDGRLVRLAPLDHETDAPIMARWTKDPLWRSILVDVARPLSVEAVRKHLEKIEKEMEQAKNFLHFTIRLKPDNRLVGAARIFRIDFHNGSGSLKLGIGDAADRRHGYGADALRLLLRFAFDDLNLHRLSAWPDEANHAFIHMAENAGFKQEGRRREATFHSGRYWDSLLMGLLRVDWEERR